MAFARQARYAPLPRHGRYRTRLSEMRHAMVRSPVRLHPTASHPWRTVERMVASRLP